MNEAYKIPKSNNWEDGRISMLAIDNGDGTFSSAIESAKALKTQSFDFAKRSSFNTVFGELVVASRQNNINIPFIRNNGNAGLESNLKSADFFQSGTAIQSHINQTAYLETGLSTGMAEIKSKNTNRYITGHISDQFFTSIYIGNESSVDSDMIDMEKDCEIIGNIHEKEIK